MVVVHEDFDSGKSQASATYPKQCSALRKNEFVVIKSHPCKIVHMSTSKTGKHGHAKVHLVALDIFDGKKYEDICPSTHNMRVPNVTRTEYQVIQEIASDNEIHLMDNFGTVRSDLNVEDEGLKEEININVDSGLDTFVTVVKAMGTEKVMSTKKANRK